MATIDLSLALRGEEIPLDYGYALFSALARIVPQVHGDRRIGVHPIRGIKSGPGLLRLVPQSRLRLRMPAEEVAAYLALVGAGIDLDGARLLIGFPHAAGGRGQAEEPVRVEPLIPSTDLSARLVTLGQIRDPGEFEESLRGQIGGLGVLAEPSLLPSTDPRGRGGPARGILRIKGRKIVGFPVRIAGLTAEESLIVQARGLGSRRRMGCGVFVPTPSRPSGGPEVFVREEG